MFWWNLANQQSISNAPSQYNALNHVAIIATPDISSGGNDATGQCTSQVLASSMVSAINDVLYPASGGRKEFTASATNNGAGQSEIITVTHNRTGAPYADLEVGVAASINQVDNAPAIKPLFGTSSGAGGHGTDGVLQITDGEDASDGTIKQKTLTTTAAYHADSQIVNVSKVN